MTVKVIKTEKEYEKACKRIYELIHKNVEIGSKEGDELELLSILVEKYQDENNPLPPPDPIEAIKFRMEQMNLKQVDIAPLFGGVTRISEVLKKVRPLSIKMVYNLNRYLRIPLESLINYKHKFELNAFAKKKLLKNPTISNFIDAKNKQKKKLIYSE